ncbi:MAG TPA: hypothetical protein VIA62_14410 [Thermoanaerobaculia bacterium]|jgi:hypothetical protein|nr:hypothetical protein [Thermoanaerobaculia bacterium]
MRRLYFGDSYDIVKKSLISWLADFGPWSLQPMFTEPVAPAEARWFAHFLGAQLVSDQELTPTVDRDDFFASSRATHSLFLDPNTGLAREVRPSRRPHYLLFGELADLVAARPRALTLVFDQSIGYAKDELRRQALQSKLRSLSTLGVFGSYYFSHAPCLIASGDSSVVTAASRILIERFQLPQCRLLSLPAP